MPFTLVSGLGRIFEFIFNLIGANIQENVPLLQPHGLELGTGTAGASGKGT